MSQISLNSAINMMIPDEESQNLAFNYILFIQLEEYTDKNEKKESRVDRYSIDDYCPKKKLQEYLSSDLIDELENTSFEEDQHLSDINTTNSNLSFESDHESDKRKNSNSFNDGNSENKSSSEETSNPNNNHLLLKLNNIDNIKPYYPKNLFFYPQTIYVNKRKKLLIRDGDWKCPQCHNLNFSFRVKCNRCGILKEDAFKDDKNINENNNLNYENSKLNDVSPFSNKENNNNKNPNSKNKKL